MGEITEQWEVNTQLLGVDLLCGLCVNADAEDLGILLFEIVDIILIPFQFLRSSAGKGQNVKGEDNVLVAPKTAQPDPVAVLVRQLKIRSLIAQFQGGT